MYYLNSRYYDQEIGRFINADNIELILASQTSLTDKNLYAYCDNNPINRKDDNGNVWLYAAIGGGFVAGVYSGLVKTGLIVASGIVSGVYTYWRTEGNHEYKLAAAVAAGTITTIGTYAGTLFNTNRLTKFDEMVANGVATFFAGVPTEMVNIATQYDLANAYGASSNPGVKKVRTPYNVNYRYPSSYICAIV